MSKVSAAYHIVINTRQRKMTIPESCKRELYKYIYGIIRNHRCDVYRMNGIGNHIHILLELHPSVALSALIQSVKQGSSLWIKSRTDFPYFEGWGKEYFAFAVESRRIPQIIEYIKTQESHHYKSNCDDELRELCEAYGIIWHDGALT